MNNFYIIIIILLIIIAVAAVVVIGIQPKEMFANRFYYTNQQEVFDSDDHRKMMCESKSCEPPGLTPRPHVRSRIQSF